MAGDLRGDGRLLSPQMYATATTGLAFAAMSLAFAGETNLPAWFVYVAIMILVTVIDIEHRLILFVVIIPSCVFALIVAAISPEGGKPFSDFLIGGVIAFAVFFAMFLGGGAFSALAGRDEVAFGFGDVILTCDWSSDVCSSDPFLHLTLGRLPQW